MGVPTGKRYDAIIGGGGPTGLATALAMVHILGGDLAIAIVDDRLPDDASSGAHDDDPRAWAISAASRRMLQRLGIWDEIATDAQAVSRIELTDTALDAGLRPVLLSYDNVIEGGEPAAHIVPNQTLLAALEGAIERASEVCVDLYYGASITETQVQPAGRKVVLNSGNEIAADVVIAADGGRSRIRHGAGIGAVAWRYSQVGIVVTVAHDRDHEGRAVQHFLPGGPFAILPLTGARSCVTWSEDKAVADRLLGGDEAAFQSALQTRFGGELGLVRPLTAPGHFPLHFSLARSFIGERLALVGDAAHTVHPIAGQGLNLALRDAAALAECIRDGVRAGQSFGDADILERYQSWRRFEALSAAASFDILNRLFSNDIALLRSVREIGLSLIDRAPTVKQSLVREAAGLRGELPELIRLI